ncbi:MAG: hypothetical protein ABJF10_15555 [Chthoniobacter sp.]|uniref:hypothetical protein n=1 Tax=Chthoniobacter sp. TaxID=2510640 RepID=UPI0032A7847F
MNRHRWLTAGAALLVATVSAHAQLRLENQPPPAAFDTLPARTKNATAPEVNFFGNEAAQQRASGESAVPPARQAEGGYAQTLVFPDGRELHGKMIASEGEYILWQRPDASETLRFAGDAVGHMPMSEVLRNLGSDSPTPSFGQLNRIKMIPARPTADSSEDILVFKNGDELPGKALAATLRGPVRWRTADGQEVEFQPGRIAGLRLGGVEKGRATGAGEPTAMVELRTGERLRGKLVAFDEKQVCLKHTRLGTITLERSRVGRLFPDARLGAIDGGRVPAGWGWATPELPEPSKEPPVADGAHWVYLDGTYLFHGQAPSFSIPTSTLPGWQHAIDPGLERFELRFELGSAGRFPASCALTLFGRGGIMLCTIVSNRALAVAVMDPPERPQCKWRQIPLNKLQNASGPRLLRFFVDTKAGTCDIVLNGVLVARLGKDERERLVPDEYFVRLQANTNTGSLLFSNIWIGPWSGDLPHPAAGDGTSTALRNGDALAGAPKEWREGKWILESELGPLEISTEKVLLVDFGGTALAERAAGRIRLADGSSINVDAFQWDGRELAAHSPALGNVQLYAATVAEIIFDPVPSHTTMVEEPPKLAGKNTATPDAGREVRK